MKQCRGKVAPSPFLCSCKMTSCTAIQHLQGTCRFQIKLLLKHSIFSAMLNGDMFLNYFYILTEFFSNVYAQTYSILTDLLIWPYFTNNIVQLIFFFFFSITEISTLFHISSLLCLLISWGILFYKRQLIQRGGPWGGWRYYQYLKSQQK